MQAGRPRSSQQDKGGFYLKETRPLGFDLQIHVDKRSFIQMEDKSQPKKKEAKTNKENSETDHRLHEAESFKTENGKCKRDTLLCQGFLSFSCSHWGKM